MLHPKEAIYRVKRNDTLWKIAQDEYGNAEAWREIAKSNRIPDGNLILIGMVLKLPIIHTVGGKAAPSSASKLGGGLHSVTAQPSVSAPAYIAGGSSRFPAAGLALAPALTWAPPDLPVAQFSTPQFEITAQLTGNITIQAKGSMTEIELSHPSTIKTKRSAEYVAGLANIGFEVGANYKAPNPKSGYLHSTCTITTKIHGQEVITHEFSISPGTCKYSLKPKDLKWENSSFAIKGNLGFDVEIKQKNSVTPQIAAALLLADWPTIRPQHIDLAFYVYDYNKDPRARSNYS